MIIGCLIGLYCIYEAKKTQAKLLYYLGFGIAFFSLSWLGNFLDFITILLTGKNIDNSYGLVGILTFVWTPIAIIATVYVITEFIAPMRKRIIISIFLIIGIVFEILIFLDPVNSIEYIYPANPGDDLIDENIIFTSTLGILYTIYILCYIIYSGFSLLYIVIKSAGIIRKKLLFLSVGYYIALIVGFIESIIPLGLFLSLARMAILISYWLLYLGLKEEPEKKVKAKQTKEVKVEAGLFRVSQFKKEDLTEEEVSISKERKICLVCKGKVARKLYMCPECDTFYCNKCSDTLANLENACWVCGTPFDESKPVKLPKKNKDEIEIEGVGPKK
ncbi:MAG: hypothetical protein ACFFDK_19730 [Promethearchaeota archaeon]